MGPLQLTRTLSTCMAWVSGVWARRGWGRAETQLALSSQGSSTGSHEQQLAVAAEFYDASPQLGILYSQQIVEHRQSF